MKWEWERSVAPSTGRSDWDWELLGREKDVWRGHDDDSEGSGRRERRVEGDVLRQRRGGKRMSDGQRRGDLEDLELRQFIPKKHAAMLIIAHTNNIHVQWAREGCLEPRDLSMTSVEAHSATMMEVATVFSDPR